MVNCWKSAISIITFDFQVGFGDRVTDAIRSTAFDFRFVRNGGFVNEKSTDIALGTDLLATIAEYFQPVFVPGDFRCWYAFERYVKLYLNKIIG